jgi:hypothetical protein
VLLAAVVMMSGLTKTDANNFILTGGPVGNSSFRAEIPPHVYLGAALILFLGVTGAVEMPTDIFPEINIPVVFVIRQYTGLDTIEMEQRFTTYSQFAISTNGSGIKDMKAETVNGISVQKIYFQPDVDLSLAISAAIGRERDGLTSAFSLSTPSVLLQRVGLRPLSSTPKLMPPVILKPACRLLCRPSLHPPYRTSSYSLVNAMPTPRLDWQQHYGAAALAA